MNNRCFPVKAGDSFIFESHMIQKIENVGASRLVVIMGSHTSNLFTIDDYNISLTDRQLQVLFFLLRGKTIKQTARIIGLSNRTVDDYLKQCELNFQRKTNMN